MKGPAVRHLPHPAPGEPGEEFFAVSGEELGTAEIAILFEQDSSDIGQVYFTVDVVGQVERQDTVGQKTLAEQNGQPDKHRLKLVIIQTVSKDNEIRYDYLVSFVLKLENQPYSTDPFRIAGTGSAGSWLAYVVYGNREARLIRSSAS